VKLRISHVIPVLLIAGSLALLATGPRAADTKKTAKANSRSGTSAAIPTFPNDDLARTGIFYAGGQYEGELGKETMGGDAYVCLLYTSPSPRDLSTSRMPSSA